MILFCQAKIAYLAFCIDTNFDDLHQMAFWGFPDGFRHPFFWAGLWHCSFPVYFFIVLDRYISLHRYTIIQE
jgi:hypothetical protein